MWDGFTGDTLYLDTNIIIYALEAENRWSALLRDLFEAIDDRAVHAFTSEITLAEVLVKPFAEKALDVVAQYERLLARDSLIRVVPIDQAILRTAAILRARLGLKLVDAIHAATAKSHGCDFLLTNDDELGRKLAGEIKWIRLEDVTEEAR